MKITVRCERCDTILREHDLPNVGGANIAVAPCPNCVKNNDGMSDPDRLLTVPEVADTLRLSQRRVRQLIAERELTAIRVGRNAIRVPARVLDAYIADRTIPAVPA